MRVSWRRWTSTAALAVVLLMGTLGIAPRAWGAPGEGPGVGWRVGNYGHAGSYRLSVGEGFCADANGTLPGPVSGWTAGAPAPGERKQVGIKGPTGRAGLTGPVVTAEEWAYLAALLEAVKPHANKPAWAAAADHLVRATMAGDAAQADYEQWRYAALVAEHAEVPGIVASLDALARSLLDLRLEMTWERQPTAASDGVVRVRLVNGAGQPVLRPVTVWLGQTPLEVVDGRASVPGGNAGEVVVTARAEVSAAQPVVWRPAQYENPASPDYRGQRVLSGGAPRTLMAELRATVAPLRPQVVTQTSQVVAQPGSAITDKVVVTNADGYRATGQAILWGPYASHPTAKDCRPGDPQAGSVPLTINGNGTYTTAAVTVRQPGYYVWQEVLPATPNAPALITACGMAEETTQVPPPPTPVRSPSPTPTPTPSLTPTPTPVRAGQPIVRAGGSAGPWPMVAGVASLLCAAGGLGAWRWRR